MNKSKIIIYYRPIRIGQLRDKPYWWFRTTVDASLAIDKNKYIIVLIR